MKKPDFRPLGNRYLVLSDPIEDESETIGDVTLSKPKDPNKQAEEGTVIARGKSCVDVGVGAKVYYGKYSGYDRQIDGVDYKILQENELLGEHFVTPLDGTEIYPPGTVFCHWCSEPATTTFGSHAVCQHHPY
jgi:co-chaperonin GroES (HSP10)